MWILVGYGDLWRLAKERREERSRKLERERERESKKLRKLIFSHCTKEVWNLMMKERENILLPPSHFFFPA